MILSDALNLPLSQLRTQQVTTNLGHIEYLIQTFYILVLILYYKLMKNLVIMAGFVTI